MFLSSEKKNAGKDKAKEKRKITQDICVDSKFYNYPGKLLRALATRNYTL